MSGPTSPTDRIRNWLHIDVSKLNRECDVSPLRFGLKRSHYWPIVEHELKAVSLDLVCRAVIDTIFSG